MDKNHPIIEPDFAGVAMRMPTAPTHVVEESAPKTSILSLPIIILLFLILVAILGGFYYWYTIVMSQAVITPTLTRPTAEQNNEPESTTAEARTGLMDVVSTSDELGAIAADVNSTNLADLDSEISAIETELDAAEAATKP